MSTQRSSAYEPWPILPYEEFKPTAHLLHMATQAIGKLKLVTPFEPHWSNVALWLTSRGLTTGPIPYEHGTFSVDIDLISHHIICTSSWGNIEEFKITTMSVAQLTESLFKALHDMNINLTINTNPQEISNPIPFEKDTTIITYNASLANAWWRILVSSYRIMQQYHARFLGATPPVGLMWGTFDLRDARYYGPLLKVDKDIGFIRRNAMDEAQVEVGWWIGNEEHPRPAYFSFTYPQPNKIEDQIITPQEAHWDNKLSEFILDYDDVRKSKDPEKSLLEFFESTYKVGAKQAGWDTNLIGPTKPA